jgi:hypothetical protein
MTFSFYPELIGRRGCDEERFVDDAEAGSLRHDHEHSGNLISRKKFKIIINSQQKKNT